MKILFDPGSHEGGEGRGSPFSALQKKAPKKSLTDFLKII
jgi:hypothetical protein